MDRNHGYGFGGEGGREGLPLAAVLFGFATVDVPVARVHDRFQIEQTCPEAREYGMMGQKAQRRQRIQVLRFLKYATHEQAHK